MQDDLVNLGVKVVAMESGNGTISWMAGKLVGLLIKLYSCKTTFATNLEGDWVRSASMENTIPVNCGSNSASTHKVPYFISRIGWKVEELRKVRNSRYLIEKFNV